MGKLWYVLWKLHKHKEWYQLSHSSLTGHFSQDRLRSHKVLMSTLLFKDIHIS